MTNEEFKSKLSQAGMNKKTFAERFNISQSAVNNWSNKPIPGWVEPVVELLKNHVALMEKNLELRATVKMLTKEASDRAIATTINSLGERVAREISEDEANAIRREVKELLEKTERERKQELEEVRQEMKKMLEQGKSTRPDDQDKN